MGNKTLNPLANYKKKLLFVTTNLGIGGAQKSLITLLNVLDYEKYEVDLIVFNKDGVYMKDVPAQVNIVDLPQEVIYFFSAYRTGIKNLIKHKNIRMATAKTISPVVRKFKIKSWHSEQVIWDLIKRHISIINKNYDIAIANCQGLSTFFVVDNIVAKRKIAWMRNDMAHQTHNHKYNLEYYKSYDLINCVSNKAKASFCEIYPEMKDKVKTFYNFVDKKRIKELASVDSKIFDNVPKESIKIVSVGRLVEQKGYDLTINALHILRRKGYPVKWWIIGEGNNRSKLEELISSLSEQNNIFLLGAKENPFTLMKNCDIYVQTSKWEGFGRTLAEAKALKKPIVTTNFAGADEQIINEVTGLIVDIKVEAIVRGIEKLIVNNELKENLVKNLEELPENYKPSIFFDEMIINLSD